MNKEHTSEARLIEEANHEKWLKKQEHDCLNAVSIDIATLRKDAENNLQLAIRLERLLCSYPDLLKNTNRWKRVRYYAKSANSRLTDYEMTHNCGCCSDSPLEIWPYVETPDGKVYSDPPCFRVGEDSSRGDIPWEGWDDEMRSVGIPEAIVEKVRFHFEHEKETQEDE